ncbi:hypothetical protein PRIPAC_70225 [Pristionchus pacificus]|uniref:Uncharacterized protein n=1 Tax=Pristionchus pacificus TaxID=54126 RepID=A0A2A6C5F6_PRIPA|nr:hypothetical protein PRIPAC_70225 [Pristionchus pacificus]|eukprot:PDM73452.1 hypothetical protein PRIPAC_40808 [Pristionchus pacificus]
MRHLLANNQENSVTYTVQAVVLLTLPQCLFYVFIAIFIGEDLPILVGTCSFIKHYSSNAAQAASIVPPVRLIDQAEIDSSTEAYLYLMDPRFFSFTVLLSSYNVTATHNGSLLALGHLVWALYLLSTRARADQIKLLQGIAICHHLHLVWMYNLDRVHIALFIALMGIPQVGNLFIFHSGNFSLRIEYKHVVTIMPPRSELNYSDWTRNRIHVLRHSYRKRYMCPAQPLPESERYMVTLICANTLSQSTQFYLLFIQPVGIGMQMYNNFYLRRLLRKKNYDRKNHAKYLAEYHATHIMIGHLTVMLAAISLKFAFVILTKYLSDTYVQSGALLKTATGKLFFFIESQTLNQKLQTSVTYTVQAVVILTLPQCLFYLLIAIVVRKDYPIQIGPCSFIKHFSSFAARTSYLVPSSIAFCHHLQLVWMFNPDRVNISLFMTLLAVPLTALAISFTFFGMPQIHDICAQLLVYRNNTVPTMVQFYLLFIQPFGIGLQLYNLYYLRRFIPRPKKENLKKRRASMAPNKAPPRPSAKILSKYLAEYHATIGMLAHVLIMLIAIGAKFSFDLILMFTNRKIQSGALLKIIDLIPYTMPGWVGLISILCISDSRSAIGRFFRYRNFKRAHNQQTTTISLTVASL